LQEYVCHKVDKRIAEVIKRRNKERLAKAAALAKKEAMGDFSHLKNKKGELIAKPLPQPTLPNLSVDDEFDDTSSMRTRGPPPSSYTQDYHDYKSEYTQDYPPMPAYNQPYSQSQGQQGSYYTQSTATFVEDDHQHPNATYDDDQGSTAHLALSAAPFAQQGPERPGTTQPNLPNPYGSSGMNGSYVADPHDVYQGRAIPSGDFTRRSPQPQGEYTHYQPQNGGMGGGHAADMQEYQYPISNAQPSHLQPSHPQPSHPQSFGAHPQTHQHQPEDPYGGYDYEGQRYTEQGYHGGGGGGGYTSHAL
jgi:hypothetical protein